MQAWRSVLDVHLRQGPRFELRRRRDDLAILRVDMLLVAVADADLAEHLQPLAVLLALVPFRAVAAVAQSHTVDLAEHGVPGNSAKADGNRRRAQSVVPKLLENLNP